ncbi:MAG: SDR family oxidoreductase [Leptospiraceae bacterium]|nr:SDR family oxidoreductase [Leptospiraceae bacterium]
MEWKGKKVLLTGATGGFGSRLAERLARKGASLFLADLKIPRDFSQRIETLATDTVQTLSVDLSTDAGCKKLCNAVVKNFGPLDVIIHNAGIARKGAFQDVPLEEMERVMAVNLLAPMRISHRLYGSLRDGGLVVHLSSVAGILSPAGLSSYAVTKWGIRSLGDVLDQEWSVRNIRVLNIHPFFARTAILESPDYGSGAPPHLPSWLVNDPDKVVDGMIRAMEKRKRRYLPGLHARLSYLGYRLMPDLIHFLSRRSVQKGKHPIVN